MDGLKAIDELQSLGVQLTLEEIEKETGIKLEFKIIDLEVCVDED